MAERELVPGDRIKNYVLEERLGKGASGEVWKANDGMKTVALKLMNPQLIASANAAKHRIRLRREIEALESLRDHPNIPTLYDADLEYERPYLAMQFIGGASYDRLIRTGELLRLPLERRLDIIRELAMALAAAHQKDIIHRDMKPANVSGTENPYLLDFSVALAEGELDKTQANIGTRLYMPYDGLQDKRGDVYGFGLVAYEILFGRHAIFGPEDNDLLRINAFMPMITAGDRIKTEAWRVPSRMPLEELPGDLLNKDLRPVDAVFFRVLGRHVDRYGDPREFATDLRRALLEGIMPSAAPPAPPVEPPEQVAQPELPVAAPPEPEPEPPPPPVAESPELDDQLLDTMPTVVEPSPPVEPEAEEYLGTALDTGTTPIEPHMPPATSEIKPARPEPEPEPPPAREPVPYDAEATVIDPAAAMPTPPPAPVPPPPSPPPPPAPPVREVAPVPESLPTDLGAQLESPRRGLPLLPILIGVVVIAIILIALLVFSGGPPGGGATVETLTPMPTTAVALAVTDAATVTDTVLPPTSTRIPSTAAPVPPTATMIPPTATDLPPTLTSTPLPPTVTDVPPTETPLPPTATFTTTVTLTATPEPPTATPTATETPTPLPPTATFTVTASDTPIPPTSTRIPPTATTEAPTVVALVVTEPPSVTPTLTPEPPTATDTPVPPTSTRIPTETATATTEPPTAMPVTSTERPSETPVPPTATRIPRTVVPSRTPDTAEAQPTATRIPREPTGTAVAVAVTPTVELSEDLGANLLRLRRAIVGRGGYDCQMFNSVYALLEDRLAGDFDDNAAYEDYGEAVLEEMRPIYAGFCAERGDRTGLRLPNGYEDANSDLDILLREILLALAE
jgi:serine/threonine protein kinase